MSEEESQNLVGEQSTSEESVVHVGAQESRNVSCNRGSLVTALTVLVAVLVASQAIMAVFVTRQHSKISELDQSNRELKLQEMIKKLPGSLPAQDRPKMRMATFNIPMALKVFDGSPGLNDLEELAESSNKLEDAAKYMLVRENPLRKYPSFNGSMLENLKKLRKTLSDQEWRIFDTWMHYWYMFSLVQNTEDMEPNTAPKKEEPVPPYHNHAVTGAPLMTKCQVLSKKAHLPGDFKPQCEENGDYKSLQCWHSTGYCWCAYRNGTEIPETRTRAKLDCSNLVQPEDRFFGSTSNGDYDLGDESMQYAADP